MSDVKPLTSKMQRFVDEMIIDFDRTQAAIRAGYSKKTAKQQAYRLMQDPRIDAAIDAAIAERAKRCHITADHVLLKYWAIANADYNELSSVIRSACEYCHIDEPSNKTINNDCTVCQGQGVPHVHIADTTKLSPEAKLVYQGAKETKFGIEIMTADRMKALDNVARHLGMFTDKVEVSGGLAIDTISALMDDLADDETTR